MSKEKAQDAELVTNEPDFKKELDVVEQKKIKARVSAARHFAQEFERYAYSEDGVDIRMEIMRKEAAAWLIDQQIKSLLKLRNEITIQCGNLQHKLKSQGNSGSVYNFTMTNEDPPSQELKNWIPS